MLQMNLSEGYLLQVLQEQFCLDIGASPVTLMPNVMADVRQFRKSSINATTQKIPPAGLPACATWDFFRRGLCCVCRIKSRFEITPLPVRIACVQVQSGRCSRSWLAVRRAQSAVPALDGHAGDEARARCACALGAGVQAVQHAARQADVHALQGVVQHGGAYLDQRPYPVLKLRMRGESIAVECTC
jgi:hypothetical protein